LLLLFAEDFALAKETASKVFAPSFDLFSVPSRSIKILSISS
tara:strand:- start:732 stop:857 length:126 start_codon:yes stop_codon:yes gene_type:complete